MALDLNVKLHPVVLFQIVDAYERRAGDTFRVIGTLLGSVDKGCVEITNCFCVPHKEYEEKVEADLKFASDVHELNRLVSPGEGIVGWWATGNEVTSQSALIHDYYTRECSNPIHLTVDTNLQGGQMGIKAYVCVPIGVPGGTTGNMFTPAPVEIVYTEPEIVGVNICQQSNRDTKCRVELPSELERISTATDSMETLLDEVLCHVDEIVSGRAPADCAVGRALLDMVHSVPKLAREQFEEMINSNMKDLLMVVYLSQLTRTQLQLSEKLTLLAATS